MKIWRGSLGAINALGFVSPFIAHDAKQEVQGKLAALFGALDGFLCDPVDPVFLSTRTRSCATMCHHLKS